MNDKIKKIIKEEIKRCLAEAGEAEIDAGFKAPIDGAPLGEPVEKKPSVSDMRYANTLAKYYEHISHEVTLMEAGMETFRRKLSVIDPVEIQKICDNIKSELSKVDDILNKTARS